MTIEHKTLRSYLEKVPHFIWRNQKVEVIAIGTAHVSAQSLKDVETVFELYQPNAVAVELCKQRLQVLMEPERWKHLNIAELIKQKKIWLLCSSLILSAFQKKLAQDVGVLPGMEMKTTVELAQKNKIKVILADREIRTTLARAWAKIGFFSRFHLGSFLLTSLFVTKPIPPEEIERMKSKDVLEDLLSELPKAYIPLKNIILDERDSCLAENIRQGANEITKHTDRPQRILAVLGAAHLKGVKQNLQQKKPINLTELLSIPQRHWSRNIFSWLVFAIVFCGISAMLFREAFDPSVLRELLVAWVLSRSIGAGIGALVTCPTIPTFVLTVLCAPISYFLSIIGVRLWMVSALTEIHIRKPRVEDFENIAKDTQSFFTFGRSLYCNRVIHLLFLIFFVSLGLTIGNLFFFKFVFFE